VIGPQHMYATQKETRLPCFITAGTPEAGGRLLSE
jgi:hypothetical protein